MIEKNQIDKLRDAVRDGWLNTIQGQALLAGMVCDLAQIVNEQEHARAARAYGEVDSLPAILRRQE